MQPTTILAGQLTVVLLLMLAGLVAATQWTAAALGYQAALGAPFAVWHGIPLYPPWRFLHWWFVYDAYAPRIFNIGGAIACLGGLAGTASAIAGSVWRARQAGRVITFGSAHWANNKEVAAAGLTAEAGLFLGRLGPSYLRHDGPEHVMAFAPTRSGKGVGLVVPSLLSWTGSAVIHDIKGENWQLTAGWRQRFSHCLLFNPTDPRSAAYNPLLEIRRGAREVRDAQNVADILVDPEGALERRNHWEKTSHALLVGAILHILYVEPEKTLARVAGFLSDPARSFEATLVVMMTTPHLGSGGVHPVVASAARELFNKSDNERSGVLSTAMSFLGLYRDPTVAAVTSRCDWRIADLVAADHPVSLYLVVPPSDISRTKPLIRLILNQIGRRLTESLDGVEDAAAIDASSGGPKDEAEVGRAQTGDAGSAAGNIATRRSSHDRTREPAATQSRPRRHKLLLMLDEFPALGRLDFFESALAFMAGYGLRAVLIAQSLNQIEKAYGPNNAILDNCHIRVAFATNDERTARRISDALGTATELRAQRNFAGHRLALWLGHVMVSRAETARPLLTPGEVMQLPPSEEIVMVAGVPPVRAQKLRYYDDRHFTARVLLPPVLSEGGYADRPAPRGDDWAGWMPADAKDDAAAAGARAEGGISGAGGATLAAVVPEAASMRAADVRGSDDAGGLHRAPKRIAAPRAFAAIATDAPADLALLADEDGEDGSADPWRGALDRTARLAALDPDDGIAL